jgi:cellobiose phosphorylase
MLGQPGGVHLLSGTETEALALESLSALTLRSGYSLRQQLGALRTPLPETEEKPLSIPESVPPELLNHDNGFGGYTRDGAYCVTKPAPVPWHQLLCGKYFGTVVCETGILTSFAGNSRLGRVTRATPDVYRGVPSEEIYLTDEEGCVWPLTRGAAVYEPGLAVYHALAGQTLCQTAVFSHLEKSSIL